jgi:outer membrane protein
MQKSIVLLGLLLILMTPIFAASQKIAYVDSKRILEESKDMVTANEALENERKNWDIQLKEIESELQRLQDSYDAEKLMLSEEGKKEAEKAIQDKQRERDEFLNRVFGENGEAVQRNNELLTPIINKVQIAIEKVAVDKGFDLILDMNTTGIMYAKKGLDLTDDVLEAMEDETLSAEAEESTSGNSTGK